MTTAISTSTVLKVLAITPRTKAFTASWNLNYCNTEWRKDALAELSPTLGVKVYSAVQGLKWALSTGRLSAEVESAVLNLSAYQYAKLAVEFALANTLQNDIPRLLVKKFAK